MRKNTRYSMLEVADKLALTTDQVWHYCQIFDICPMMERDNHATLSDFELQILGRKIPEHLSLHRSMTITELFNSIHEDCYDDEEDEYFRMISSK